MNLNPVRLKGGQKGASKWRVQIIKAGKDLNGVDWPAEVLQAATPLFDGAIVRAYSAGAQHFEHLPEGTPDERGNVGRLSNPRWDEKLTSINADMTVRGSAAWLTSLLTEQQLNGESLLGLSVDVRGAGEERVTAISSVAGVDVVSHPAAGGAIQRRVAEAKSNTPKSENVKLLLERLNILERRIYTMQDQDQDQEDRKMSQQDDDICGAVTVEAEERDRFSAAMRGMFEGRDVEDVPRFRSLHQSWRVMTRTTAGEGEVARGMYTAAAKSLCTEHHPGGQVEYNKQRRFSAASLAVSDWAEAFGDSVTRRLVDRFQAEVDDVRALASFTKQVRDFRTQNAVIIGGLGDLDTVGEGTTYQEVTPPTDTQATYAVSKRGNLYSINWEAFVNDDIGAIRRVPDAMKKAAVRTFRKFILNDLIAKNSNIYDSTALFTSGHGNLQTTALAAAALDTAIQDMETQTERDSGEAAAYMPKFLVHPSVLRKMAWDLTVNELDPSDVSATLMSRFRTLYGIVPVWNDVQVVDTAGAGDATKNWFLVADPTKHETLEIGFLESEDPQIFIANSETEGSMFTADQISLKVRHIYSGAILDYRAFQGNLVA